MLLFNEYHITEFRKKQRYISISGKFCNILKPFFEKAYIEF